MPLQESAVTARLNQAVVEREDDGGGPVADVELCEDVAEVGLDRALAEHQLGGDLGVAEPRSDEGEHLAFTLGEYVELGSRLGWLDACAVRREHPAGDARVEP